MLILKRKIGEKIKVDETTITIHKIERGAVSLCFDAPREVEIYRIIKLPQKKVR